MPFILIYQEEKNIIGSMLQNLKNALDVVTMACQVDC